MRVFSTAYFFSLTSSLNDNTPSAEGHSSAEPFPARDGANAKAKSDQAGRSLFRDAHQKRGLWATNNQALRWPGGKLYLDLSHYPPSHQGYIRDAVEQLNNSLKGTCFSIEEVNGNFPGPKVVVTSDTSEPSCWSVIGCEACTSPHGVQELRLTIGACTSPKITKHELLHAMGMLHTHTRPDREKYLKIMKANIDPKAYANFEVRKTGGDTFGLDFDHESIMMYKALDSFAIGPDYNIKVRAQSDSAKDYQIALERFKKLGTYQNLSKGDIATVAAMYGKRPNCPKVTNQQVISTNGATNPGTLTYPTNGATNPGTLTYRTTAGTYPTQLTYRTTAGTYPTQLTYPTNGATNQYYGQPTSGTTAGTYPTQLTYPTTGGTYQYYWQPASASLRR